MKPEREKWFEAVTIQENIVVLSVAREMTLSRDKGIHQNKKCSVLFITWWVACTFPC